MENIDFTENRDQMVEALKDNICKVVFTKTDGNERTMLCTLKQDMLPIVEKKEGDENKPVRKPNLEVIASFDVEAEGWRSFRLDSVTSFEVV